MDEWIFQILSGNDMDFTFSHTVKRQWGHEEEVQGRTESEPEDLLCHLMH